MGPLGTTSKITVFITISTVLSSWAPPGFSCPHFINYMEITVFIDIVTPNGLLNFMIFSIFLQIPNYRKNKENMNCLFFITISTVLSSWAPPGFSCPYFINYMKITVFINIVTPNGLLNLMIFSVFLQNPNYQKTKKT